MASELRKNISAVEVPQNHSGAPLPKDLVRERSSHNLAVNISGNSHHVDETEAAGNTDVPLKGLHVDSLACWQSSWVPEEGQQLGRRQRHRGKD